MKALKIETISLEDITPYDRNAKLHPDSQIEQITESIEEFGMNDPIAVWGKENLIVEGHGRYEACKRIGLDAVPIIRLDHLTDEQRKAYTLVHNKLTLNSDFDLEMLNSELRAIQNDIDMSDFGFDMSFLDEKESGGSDDNFEGAIPAVPKTQRGDMYKLGDHFLLCGDASDAGDVNRLMGQDKADLLITDPPYGIDYADKADSIGEKKHSKTRKKDDIQADAISEEELENLLSFAFANASDHMRPGAAFYIWYASKKARPFLNALDNTDLTLRQELIWVKNAFSIGRNDYQWKHEPCLYGWKDGKSHYFTSSRKEVTVFDDTPDLENMDKEELIKLLRKIYDVNTTTIYENKPLSSDMHPTMKPVPLMATIMANSSLRGELVLDLFGGSGSTLIAGEQLGRKVRIMEIEPRYCDVIVERWEQFTEEKAVLLDG